MGSCEEVTWWNSYVVARHWQPADDLSRTYLLHELKEDIQELWYEGLHLLQAICVKGIYEAAKRHNCINSHLYTDVLDL